MVNAKYNTTGDMIDKSESVKGKTKLIFYKNISNSYDEMNYRRQNNIFQFEEDTFGENAQGIGKIFMKYNF